MASGALKSKRKKVKVGLKNVEYYIICESMNFTFFLLNSTLICWIHDEVCKYKQWWIQMLQSDICSLFAMFNYVKKSAPDSSLRTSTAPKIFSSSLSVMSGHLFPLEAEVMSHRVRRISQWEKRFLLPYQRQSNLKINKVNCEHQSLKKHNLTFTIWKGSQHFGSSLFHNRQNLKTDIYTEED